MAEEKVVEERVVGDGEERRYHVRFSVACMPVGQFYDISGTERCDVHRYFIKIRKSPVFDWAEIQPKVVAILKAYGTEASRTAEVPA